MPVEFNVTLQDRPGTLARLGQMLGEAAVNIEAIQGMSREGHGFIHFVPRDPQQAARVLDAAGIGYSQREVLIVKVINTASPTVLRAFGLAEAEISEILQNRRYGPYTDVSRFSGRGLVATTQTFRVEAEGLIDAEPRARLTAVVRKRTEGAGDVLVILDWFDGR